MLAKVRRLLTGVLRVVSAGGFVLTDRSGPVLLAQCRKRSRFVQRAGSCAELLGALVSSW